METCSVVLTFGSVDELLWHDHSNETSFADVCTYYLFFIILHVNMKFGIFHEFWFWALLVVKWLVKETFIITLIFNLPTRDSCQLSSELKKKKS